MNNHLKGLIITTLGIVFVVPDALFVRVIDAEPLVIAFWRCMTAGTIIMIVTLSWKGFNGFSAVLRTGWPGVIYTVLIGTTAPGFVMAVANTSVANVVFIFATIPIFAAIFSRIFLGEPFSRRMVLTMAVVIVGLGIIAYGSAESEIASWKGDLWALYVSCAFAAALTAVRKVKETSMIPAIPIGFISIALLISLFVAPLPAIETQWPVILAHGAFIGVSSCLLTLGPRYISSTEVALLVLLESILAPLLVWAVIGENPGVWALMGGAVVIGALLVSNLIALRRNA